MRTAFRDLRVILSTPTLCGDSKGVSARGGDGGAARVTDDDVAISVGRVKQPIKRDQTLGLSLRGWSAGSLVLWDGITAFVGGG